MHLCVLRRCAYLVLTLQMAAGCGKAHPPTYAVTGKVAYADGSTMPHGGRVVFTCNVDDKTFNANGDFGADGRFELTTFTPQDGAVAGEHRVAVFPIVPDDRGSMSEKEFRKALFPVDDRFKNPNTSGIQFTVNPEGTPHDFSIEVRRPQR